MERLPRWDAQSRTPPTFYRGFILSISSPNGRWSRINSPPCEFFVSSFANSSGKKSFRISFEVQSSFCVKLMKVYGIFLSRFPLFSHLRPSSSLPSTRCRIRGRKMDTARSIECRERIKAGIKFIISLYHRIIIVLSNWPLVKFDRGGASLVNDGLELKNSASPHPRGG